MLTRKQLELLDFIKTRMDRDGVPPSFDEMKDALDLRSKSGIHRLITALEERGFIRRLAHRARALEIVKLPEAMEKPGFSPKVIAGDRVDPPRGAMRRTPGRPSRSSTMVRAQPRRAASACNASRREVSFRRSHR